MGRVITEGSTRGLVAGWWIWKKRALRWGWTGRGAQIGLALAFRPSRRTITTLPFFRLDTSTVQLISPSLPPLPTLPSLVLASRAPSTASHSSSVPLCAELRQSQGSIPALPICHVPQVGRGKEGREAGGREGGREGMKELAAHMCFSY